MANESDVPQPVARVLVCAACVYWSGYDHGKSGECTVRLPVWVGRTDSREREATDLAKDCECYVELM